MALSPEMRWSYDRVYKFNGPLARVYACPYCKFFIKLPKGGLGRIRGWGAWQAYSAGASSRTAAHIRAEHADKFVPLTNATEEA
jgi:hypothetical protein